MSWIQTPLGAHNFIFITPPPSTFCWHFHNNFNSWFTSTHTTPLPPLLLHFHNNFNPPPPSSIFITFFFSIFSSPEPKAQGELIVYRSSRRLCVWLFVCVSVDIFKLEYLHNQWANRNEILTESSLGWGKGCIRFWARSDRNSGVHGNV